MVSRWGGENEDKEGRISIPWIQASATEKTEGDLVGDAARLSCLTSGTQADQSAVYMISDSYSANGIGWGTNPVGVFTKPASEESTDQMLTTHLPQVDPGVLAVEGFLTEEEEASILEALGDDGPDDEGDEELEEGLAGSTVQLFNSAPLF